MNELLRLDWLTAADVFTLRQRGREVAAALGLDGQDQIRLATALSEVGRELLGEQPVTALFTVDADPQRLVVTLTGPAPDGSGVGASIAAARRLLDDAELGDDDVALTIVLTKRLPRTVADVGRLREVVREVSATTPADELRIQNADLVATLDALRERQQDLEQANRELEETNLGVLAMYNELSGELEETNRGVVALYAELDEKSRLLVEANEAKTRFLRNVSHELRAPVNSILGLTSLLGDAGLDAEGARQIAYLRSSAQSLLDLVNELLDLARAEADRIDLTMSQVELAPLFADLRGTLRPVAIDRGIELLIEDPGALSVWGEPALLGRVLRNLLVNALDFCEEGQVRLTAHGLGPAVDLRVTDTGIGIAPENQARVFEEFFQVPGPVQTRRSGTGLGLPYARRVAEALGGSLTLTSEAGAGSTFTVRLTAQNPAPPPGTIRGDVGHVLVVDDDDAFRHILRGMLQGSASRVSEAGDGEQALALMREVRPDVVLLDLRMPNVDGATMLARLRADADPDLRETPVVLMTSVDIDASVRRAAEPAAALLAKADLARETLFGVLERAREAKP